MPGGATPETCHHLESERTHRAGGVLKAQSIRAAGGLTSPFAVNDGAAATPAMKPEGTRK